MHDILIITMIIIIVGGVGSGKSVSIVKEIFSRKKRCFTNFSCSLPNVHRLKEEDLLIESDEKGKKKKVNWDFWRKEIKKGGFDIYLDEVHNILHSRRSMSSWNTMVSIWLSQIRKILGSSEKNHLYLITQRISAIDISARQLCHQVIKVNKIIDESDQIETITKEMGRKKISMIPKVIIIKEYFTSDNPVQQLETYQEGYDKPNYRTAFIANPYFKFYDSYELIEFGESAYI